MFLSVSRAASCVIKEPFGSSSVGSGPFCSFDASEELDMACVVAAEGCQMPQPSRELERRRSRYSVGKCFPPVRLLLPRRSAVHQAELRGFEGVKSFWPPTVAHLAMPNITRRLRVAPLKQRGIRRDSAAISALLSGVEVVSISGPNTYAELHIGLTKVLIEKLLGPRDI